ncbi:MAG TPA: hypothetical protein PKY59_05080 [Pyrinomonadaceae bacterium]|nr:hypothetical protein [Pyrinomonadaceae bacterium]
MIRAILITFISLILLEPPPIGCSYFAKRVPETAFPEKVGKFKRESFQQGGLAEISAQYADVENLKKHTVSMSLNSAESEKDAESFLNLSIAKCSAENLANNVNIELIQSANLFDRSGKKIGILRICKDFEQNSDNFHIEMTNGKVVFFIRTNNLSGEAEKSENLSLNELIEFAKNISFNANLDFDSAVNTAK